MFGDLTMIRASIPILREVGSRPNIPLIFLGGVHLPAHALVVGPQTIDNLNILPADKLFLGPDGLTFTHGMTAEIVLEAEFDRAMIKTSSEVIVVSASVKIGLIGLATIIPLIRIDKLVTDTEALRIFTGPAGAGS